MFYLLSFLSLLIILIIVVLLIPIDMLFSLNMGRISLSWHKIKLFDQELKIILDDKHIEKTKKYGKAYLRLLTHVNYKKMQLAIQGMNYQYSISPAYYGVSHGLLSILENYLNSYNIDFSYSLRYQGDSYIQFSSIIELHLGRLILEFLRIKGGKYERPSH